MRFIHRLRFRFDEAYRIRIGVGLSPLRSKREVKALIAFCKEELKDRKHMKLNPDRWSVYKETVRLYRTNSAEFHYYVNEHVGWYWN